MTATKPNRPDRLLQWWPTDATASRGIWVFFDPWRGDVYRSDSYAADDPDGWEPLSTIPNDTLKEFARCAMASGHYRVYDTISTELMVRQSA